MRASSCRSSPGTLAKLDRDAPEYGIGKYNDFNTFYLQAASGTSGGSSGSPVIDIQGRVIALNAGGATGNASSFYLPLGRVKRALELIQSGKAVSRGALQVVFHYTPYDELRRLGLNEKTEEAARKAFPALTGMLVVNEVLPGGPADGTLQPGDVLVRVNGKLVSEFEPLEQVIDDGVGGTVELDLERGGKPVSAKLSVGDLHAITPSAYLEFGDAVVHTVSYQMARHFNVAVNGVYVANPGYMLRRRRRAARRGHRERQWQAHPESRGLRGSGDGARRRRTIHRALFDCRRSQRLERAQRAHGPALVPGRITACATTRRACGNARPCRRSARPSAEAGGSTRFSRPEDPRAAALAPSLVGVGFDMPYSVSGITERNYRGTGLVVDAARGLVVVDRNTVPVSMGDVRITFAGTLEIPGKVEFVHPLHNLAIVSYDPKLIGATPVKSARSCWIGASLPGETLWVVGMGADSELNVRTTQVAAVDAHPVAAVAHHAVPREQSRDHPAGERPGGLRRCARRLQRQRHRGCGRVSPGKAAASCSRRIAASPSASCRTCSAACRRSSRCTRSRRSSCPSRWRRRAGSDSPTSG